MHIRQFLRIHCDCCSCNKFANNRFVTTKHMHIGTWQKSEAAKKKWQKSLPFFALCHIELLLVWIVLRQPWVKADVSPLSLPDNKLVGCSTWELFKMFASIATATIDCMNKMNRRKYSFHLFCQEHKFEVACASSGTLCLPIIDFHRETGTHYLNSPPDNNSINELLKTLKWKFLSTKHYVNS